MDIPHPAQHELHTYEAPEPGKEGLASSGDIAIKPRPRRDDDTEMDITPMIDMTFLLLIFFIVCSKMDPGATVSLPPAKHGDAVATKDAIIFTIAGGDTEAYIYKGKGIDPANLLNGTTPAEKEAEVAAYVEECVAKNPQITDVLIMAGSEVKHRDVSLVMKAVGMAQTDGNQLHVAVMEIR